MVKIVLLGILFLRVRSTREATPIAMPTAFKTRRNIWQVIFYIKNNGPSPLVDISKYYNIEKPSITRRVHSLEEKQIVEVVLSKNRREKIIQLTELGEEIYKVCRERITELECKVMKDIPKEQQIMAFEIFPKVLENIINEKEAKDE